MAISIAPALAQTASPVTKLQLTPPKPIPDIGFVDEQNHSGRLSDFHGRFVLLNLWATWCAPCRHEMPTLDHLQAELGGPDFEVAPLSIDIGGTGAVRKFYRDLKIQHLAIRVDGSGKSLRQLGAIGLPTTLLLDRDGQEIGRLLGPAEWDASDMIAEFRSLLSQPARAAPSRTPDPPVRRQETHP